ncbi:MAG: UDP-N-acetylglucosamine 2-epimerase (non-hydrolyzing) [Dehalococcoidia bacterium]|nr:UDP-N-acetylglucosamine 2-epimerase (non-hydrolyzing) [Dehalococcoidia bacterium]
MMKIISVVGARPNFMKIAPLIRAIQKHNANPQSPIPIQHLLIHTGQHYDYVMSQVFFQDLELPQPDIYLDVGSGTHAEQTGRTMIELEKVLFKERPDLVIVVGDVNSTLAAALAAVKLHIPVAHVEAGLRSFDRTMPEEINRLLTDAISDYLLTPSPDADENLKKEGIPDDKIFLVGDVMVDSLLYNKAKAAQSKIIQQLNLTEKGYALLTLHRPGNVDEKESLLRIIKALSEVSRRIPIVFPAHPRTQKRLKEFGLLSQFLDISPESRAEPESRPIFKHQLLITAPVGYLDFLKLEMHARFVMTDSGGIQEETTVLGIPCLTLRNSTERPITITEGSNTMVGNNTERIIEEAFKILDGKGKESGCPDLWDGRAAERIVEVIGCHRFPKKIV